MRAQKEKLVKKKNINTPCSPACIIRQTRDVSNTTLSETERWDWVCILNCQLGFTLLTYIMCISAHLPSRTGLCGTM